MNKKITWLSSIALGVALLTSCDNDYLQTYPQDQISGDEISTKIEYCKYAVNGILKTMSTQMYDVQGENGEGTTKNWHNNYKSGYSQKCGLTGWANSINGNYHVNPTNGYNAYRWTFYYKMILNANNALDMIGNYEPGNNVDNAAKKEFYLAQVYTLRAYAYMQLTQLYCKRWDDSRNGQSRGVVLRLNTSNEALPCSTLGETFAQIYKDLDTAIGKFQACGLERSENWEVNEDVAHAVYSRAAIYRQDWAKSASEAKLARANYPLMGQDEYFNGFSTVNDEWIWSLYSSADEPLHYYGYFAFAASNSSASICRQYPFAIDKMLYNSIPDSDVRKTLYLAPTEAEWKDFSKVNNKDTTFRINRTTGRAQSGKLYNRAWKDYGDWLYYDGNNISYIYMYMQFKVRCQESPSIGQLNLARAAEMYYNEAESEYKLGHEQAARDLLTEAVKPYDPNYTCTLSGDELYSEIKKYRVFDLFLEGYSYFDEKRWNQPRVRVSIQDGGSWHATFAVDTPPSAHNGWTWCIPAKETDYNEFINNNIEPDNWSKDDSSTW